MGPLTHRAEARLGKLVRLEFGARDGQRRGKAAGPAEILLFTGVRYERQEPAVPDRPLPGANAPARSGGKRSRG